MEWDAESQSVAKVEAARHLLDAALAHLLDTNDYLPAIVLAGAAEDIYRGTLGKDGKAPAASRAVLDSAAADIHPNRRSRR